MATSSSLSACRELKKCALKGHKGSVLCLAHASSSTCDPTTHRESGSAASSKRRSRRGRGHKHGDRRPAPPSSDHDNSFLPLLLSGSEDGTARLWDLRTGTRATHCLLAPDRADVVTVAWASPSEDNACTVWLSCGTNVYGYDLRLTSSTPSIVREHDHDLSSRLRSTDEINQLSVPPRPLFSHHKQRSRQPLRLAAADDGGEVRVLTGTKTLTSHDTRCTVLHHAADALVTGAVFRPHRPSQLASGGTDCTVRLWDVTRAHAPLSSHVVRRDDSHTNQVCNPPMVHALTWSPDGRTLVAGLGDGTCQAWRVEDEQDNNLTPTLRLRGGHDAVVACVRFAGPRLLASAGNDGAVFFWDVGNGETKEDDDPRHTLRGLATERHDDDDDDDRLLFGISHGHKPNWLETSSSCGGGASPFDVFVADTSNDITAYTIT